MLSRPNLDALVELTAHLTGDSGARDWTLLDEGFGSVVYEVRGWIVRAARNSDAQAGHELEARLLPAIASRLPAPVPSGLVLIGAGNGLPFGAAAYRKLPGRAMRPEDARATPELGFQVVDALAAVHAVPVPEATRLGVPRVDPSVQLSGAKEGTETFLKEALEPPLVEILTAWWKNTVEPPLSFTPALCHGDPWYGNLLVDSDGLHLAGILDFEGAVISDPAVDLAATFHLGRDFGEAAVRRYVGLRGADAGLPTRVERHRILRELSGLAYVLRHDWRDEIQDAVSKLRAVLVDLPA
jgi:aminoglycoside 2''-phosphotransferase